MAGWSCSQAHVCGQTQKHPKTAGSGPRPRAGNGQGAGEPAGAALCVCAGSSSRRSGDRPECRRLSNVAGGEGKQGQVQRWQIRMKNGSLRRPATQSHGELPGAEPRQCGGQRSLEWRWSQNRSQPGQRGAGMTQRRRPPVERSDPARTKSRQRQGRTQQIK